jgi:hypothetical protein
LLAGSGERTLSGDEFLTSGLESLFSLCNHFVACGCQLLEMPLGLGQLLCSCRDGLLSGGSFLSDRCQALLCPLQLLLEIRKTLGLSFEVSFNLTGSLLRRLGGSLQCS